MLNQIAYYQNPYPSYKQIRETNPIFQDDQDTWFLTQYDDVKMLMSDSRFSRQPPVNYGFLDSEKNETPLHEIISHWAVLNDPPRHTHLRSILTSIINPRFIKETRKFIESTADTLLKNLLAKTEADFMEAFAYPLPVNVINYLLGSELSIETTRRWARSLATALDHGSPSDFAAITPDVIEMKNYFKRVLLNREKQPSSDWISELFSCVQNNQLSLDEAVSTCIFLLLAGHETVQLTMGLGLKTFLEHPQQLKLLQKDAELIPSAIEEILRFESPLNKISRWTRVSIELNSVTIPENQLVVGMLNAANRDPKRYIHPEEFDITRVNNRHLTFGQGIHNCLGALLARIELNVFLTKLQPHLHQFSLIENGEMWLPNSSFRYLFKLMVAIKRD